MSGDTRSFSFNGTLVARRDSYVVGTMSNACVYLAEGMLKYVGVCENGKPCEMPMEWEPESTAMRFPDAFALNKREKKRKSASAGDDGDGDDESDSSLSSGSQAEEVNDDDVNGRKKAVAAAPPTTPSNRSKTALEKRKTCCIMIRDNGRLPLPHIGMSMFVYLKRGEPLETATKKSGPLASRYRYFYYDIDKVCSVKVHYGEPRSAMIQRFMLPLLPQIADDESKAVVRDMLMQTKLDKAHVFGNRMLMNRKRDMLKTTEVRVPDDLRNKMLLLDRLGSDAYTSLPLLLRAIERIAAGSSVTLLRRVLVSFVNQYAAAYNQALCVHLPAAAANGATRKPTTPIAPTNTFRGNFDRLLAFCGIQGRFGIARLAASSSQSELATLCRALVSCRLHAPQHALFTAGCLELPLWYMQNRRRLLMQFDGMYIKPSKKHNRYNSGIVLYVQQLMPDVAEDSELELVGYARALHDAVQRNFRTFASDTMLDIYQLANYAAQRNAKLARIAKRDSPTLRKVLELLLRNGALHPVPAKTVERMTTQNRLFSLMSAAERRERLTPLLVCTRQQWRISSQLVYYAKQLSPTLIPHVCGGYIDRQSSGDVNKQTTMYIYCGARPKLLRGDNDCRVSIISLAALLASTQNVNNDSLYAIELLGADEFVLCDANLLDESALLQFLQFMHLHRKFISNGAQQRITLLGDPALYSPFSALLASKRFAREFCKPCWPSRDSLEQLRYSCSTAVQDGVSMRTFCVSVGEQQLLTTAAATARILRNERRRWILVSENNRQTTIMSNKLSALFTQVANSVAAAASASIGRDQRMDALALLFARVAEGDFDMLRSHIACAAPFVAFTMHRLVVRVTGLHFMQQLAPRTEYIQPRHCQSYSVRALAKDLTSAGAEDCGELVSLDNPLLLIEIDNADCSAMAVDHRRCCWTWQPNIVHVARHRGELQAQSFCTARDALPCNDSASPIIVMGSEFRYPDLYGALVRSIPHVATEKLLLSDCSVVQLPQKTLAAYPKPRTFLGDLVASVVDTK